MNNYLNSTRRLAHCRVFSYKVFSCLVGLMFTTLFSSFAGDSGTPVEFQGIVPKAISMKQPLQLINPFAASKYGYGRGLVSWRAAEGKPKGFIVFGINCW